MKVSPLLASPQTMRPHVSPASCQRGAVSSLKNRSKKTKTWQSITNKVNIILSSPTAGLTSSHLQIISVVSSPSYLPASVDHCAVLSQELPSFSMWLYIWVSAPVAAALVNCDKSLYSLLAWMSQFFTSIYSISLTPSWLSPTQKALLNLQI